RHLFLAPDLGARPVGFGGGSHPSSSLTHFKNESSKTSQPNLVGESPAVSKVPSSHIRRSVDRDRGGTTIRLRRISRSISPSRILGREVISNVCFIAFLVGGRVLPPINYL